MKIIIVKALVALTIFSIVSTKSEDWNVDVEKIPLRFWTEESSLDRNKNQIVTNFYDFNIQYTDLYKILGKIIFEDEGNLSNPTKFNFAITDNLYTEDKNYDVFKAKYGYIATYDIIKNEIYLSECKDGKCDIIEESILKTAKLSDDEFNISIESISHDVTFKINNYEVNSSIDQSVLSKQGLHVSLFVNFDSDKSPNEVVIKDLNLLRKIEFNIEDSICDPIESNISKNGKIIYECRLFDNMGNNLNEKDVSSLIKSKSLEIIFKKNHKQVFLDHTLNISFGNNLVTFVITPTKDSVGQLSTTYDAEGKKIQLIINAL